MNTDELAGYCWDSLELQQSALFKAVQLNHIYPDGKTFVDAVPKGPLSDIIKEAESLDTLQLAGFVDEHFDLPGNNDLVPARRSANVRQHIDSLWSLLERPADKPGPGSLLPLKHPYVIPGGRFREIYYWDCYFTALGLIDSPHAYLVTAMLENFADLQKRYGIIPNGNRSYYLTRSQPPIMALLVELLLPHKQSEPEFLASSVAAMEAEYQFWMQGRECLDKDRREYRRVVRLSDGSLLNRYWDDSPEPRAESYREDIELAAALPPQQHAAFFRNVRAACESGWDFSSRWLADSHSLRSIRTTRIVPVDLNCLLYKLEQLLGEYYGLLGQSGPCAKYLELAAKRKQAICRYLWSESNGFFCDYDLDDRSNSPVLSLAGVTPLFVGVADKRQAAKVADMLATRFLRQGGLVTTTKHTPQQWDSPNGWAPLHWFAVKGLENYGHRTLAIDIADRWIQTVESFFAKSGKLMEKYDVCSRHSLASGGEYQVQEGFGWTNGVTLALYRYLDTSL